MSTRVVLKRVEDEQRLRDRLTVVLEDKTTRVCFVDGVWPTFSVPFSAVSDMVANNRSYRPCLSFPRFTGTLRPEQVNIYQNARIKLAETHVVMISCFPGFGKTITTLSLVCSLRLRAIIVCHRVCLVQQWRESIAAFCSADAVVVDLPGYTGTDYHFGIINIANVHKLNDIPVDHVLVTDETHLLLSEKRSLNLLKFCPKRFIGLTATPYRPDELHVLFKFFYGENFIVKKLFKKHDIYTVYTGIVMLERRIYGKLDWNYMLEQQATNVQRHRLLVDIIQTFPADRTWLVLVKRVAHGEALRDLLSTVRPSRVVSLLTGNVHTYDKQCDILIGTVGKIGTGFDFPKLDSLLVAADMVQYYIQFLGRVMRTINVPVVVDVVDQHAIMNLHYLSRKKEYLEHGGRIINANERVRDLTTTTCANP